MKKIVFTLICAVIAVMLFSGKGVTYSGQPPSGYSGVNGFNCSACHGSFAVNTGGGSVSVTGLPIAGYNPGQSYPLTVTVSHGAADRIRWGMVLKAQNGVGNPAGSFIAGPNTNVISDIANNDTSEISHSPAATTAAGSSYTFTGISWIAPRTPGPGDDNISFFAVGNAANGNGGPDGDHIHTAVYANINLPVTLSTFTATVEDNRRVLLHWQTTSEQNSSYFGVERSFDGVLFTEAARLNAQGAASTPTSYTFTDEQPVQFNKAIQYRLKMVDKDGRFQYSAIQSVQLAGRQTLLKRLSPNPVHAGQPLTVELVAWRGEPVQLEVINSVGQRVSTAPASLGTGYNRISLPINASLQPGNYVVVIRGDGINFQRKITVQ